MEGEISKIGPRGKRIVMSDNGYDNILPSSPLSSYLGGDGGWEVFRPTDQERTMMTSRSDHSNFLKDLQHHQDLMDCQHAVLAYIEKAAKEAQALREENISLKMANCQLTNHLVALQEATSHCSAVAVGHSGLGLGQGTGYGVNSAFNGMEVMSFLGESEEGSCEDNLENPDLVGAVDLDPVEDKGNPALDPDRVSLPKSISVRSSGYLKTAQIGGSSGVKANKQKVFVPGGEKEDEPLELDVYKQGMLKTELCNKWQETGRCPYGENCQFAHGMKELRPIIRHPRYKTEVCRMVVNGVHCPYGHRCHFRHTLTNEEKLMRSMNVDNGYAENPGLWSLE